MSNNPQRDPASESDEGHAAPPQASEQEIVDKILEGNERTETFVFETEYGDLEIDLTPIGDRKRRYDLMSKLPGRWFEASQEDDPSDVNDIASLIPDGEGITALENLIIESAQSPAIASSEMELLVRKRMSDEVVTQAGLQVLQMSMDHNTDIDGFRSK